MNTLMTFTLTPTEPMVEILAGTLIIAGVALLVTYVLLHLARTEREQAIMNAIMWSEEASKMKNELYDMRSERNAIEDELTAAKSDIEQWKALYIEHLNRANRFEELHQRMTKRPRDPKTGRIISKPKAIIAEAVNL